MKKFYILATALAFAACANEAVEVDGGGPGDVDINYLSINIAAANGGSRAENEYDDINGSYEQGNPAAESTVKTLLFYFFDNNDDAAVVDFANGASYKLYTVSDEVFPGESVEGGVNDETVEKIHKATIILQSKKVNGSYVGVPAKTLVVVNPPYTENTNLSLSEVLTKVNKTKDEFSDLTKTSGFTMSNSVYLDASGNLVNAVPIVGKVAETVNAAKDNPVDIYVERLVAKLTVEVDETSDDMKKPAGSVGSYTSNVYETGQTYGDDDPIYVHLEGWNVTTTADESRYVKAINKLWPNNNDNTNLFKTADQPWNWYAFKRSYWAYNTADVDYLFGTYDGLQASTNTDQSGNLIPDVNPALKYKTWDASQPVYVPENAGEGAGTASSWTAAETANPTKVILAATLIDKNGAPLELAQYLGQTFESKSTASDGREAYQEVQDAILAVVTAQHKLYKEKEGEFVEISAEDVDIKTAWEAKKADEETEGRYLVYLVPSTTGKNATWYNSVPSDEILSNEGDLNLWKESADNKVQAATVAGYLLEAGGAKVWKSGKTYYYYDVRHLAAIPSNGDRVPGDYGIVRNHIYKTKIVGLSGLGTPVFKPEEIIIPEKPADEFGYVAARINVLSWRIVNQDVNLEW